MDVLAYFLASFDRNQKLLSMVGGDPIRQVTSRFLVVILNVKAAN